MGLRPATRDLYGMPARKPTLDLIDHTLTVFQPRTQRRLTREDGRQIIENLTGFFRILQEWEREARQEEQADDGR